MIFSNSVLVVLVVLLIVDGGVGQLSPTLTLTLSESLRTRTDTFSFSLGTRTETFSLTLGTRTETFSNTFTDSLTLSLPTPTATFSPGTRTVTFSNTFTFSTTKTASLPTLTPTFTVPIDCQLYKLRSQCQALTGSGCMWNENIGVCEAWCASINTTFGCGSVAGCGWDDTTQMCSVSCADQTAADMCGAFRDCSPRLTGGGCETSCANSLVQWQCERQPLDAENARICNWRTDTLTCSNSCTDRTQSANCQALFDCKWENNACAPTVPLPADDDDGCALLGLACWIWALLGLLLCLLCLVLIYCLSKKKNDSQEQEPKEMAESAPIAPTKNPYEEPNNENEHVYHEFVSPQQNYMTAKTAEDQATDDFPPVTNIKEEDPTQSEDEFDVDLTTVDEKRSQQAGYTAPSGFSNSTARNPPPSIVGPNLGTTASPENNNGELIPELYDVLPSTDESRFTSPHRTQNPPPSFNRVTEPPASYTIPSSAFNRSPPTVDDKDQLYMVI